MNTQKNNESPIIVKTKDELINIIRQQMPDEYPSGMAIAFAEEWIKTGKAIIK